LMPTFVIVYPPPTKSDKARWPTTLSRHLSRSASPILKKGTQRWSCYRPRSLSPRPCSRQANRQANSKRLVTTRMQHATRVHLPGINAAQTQTPNWCLRNDVNPPVLLAERREGERHLPLLGSPSQRPRMLAHQANRVGVQTARMRLVGDVDTYRASQYM